jgi:hypothetical protein
LITGCPRPLWPIREHTVSIVQIENLVGECGHRFQQDGHYAAIPAFVIEPREMLNCGSSTLTGLKMIND